MMNLLKAAGSFPQPPERKARTGLAHPRCQSVLPGGGRFGHEFGLRTSLGTLGMSSIDRAVTAVTAILVREGLDYLQSKAVFKAARQRAALQPPPDRRAAIDRLTIERELLFINQ